MTILIGSRCFDIVDPLETSCAHVSKETRGSSLSRFYYWGFHLGAGGRPHPVAVTLAFRGLIALCVPFEANEWFTEAKRLRNSIRKLDFEISRSLVSFGFIDAASTHAIL